MSSYQPMKITGNATGLVQEREEFLLPDDAYPNLENAFVWRERIKRKQGCITLGRLQRIFTAQALGNASGGGTFSGNIITIFTLETTSEITVGSVVVKDGTHTFTDNGLGVLVGVPSGSGTINYATGAITITGATGGAALTISFNYYPGLPVMGLRTEELNTPNKENTVAFDTKYAYQFVGTSWQEFLLGTTWTGSDSNFFWTTNYWVDNSTPSNKIFWETNFSGTSGDPIRYTNGQSGTNWVNFAPTIDSMGNKLQSCLAMTPFRGRMVTFNTLEGATLAASQQFQNRIRWAAIGNPFDIVSAIVTTVSINAWHADIRGKGGFLDIPTSEAIISIGFVRDNLVVYCERSTWQLRYTGRSIAPFQIERVNSELGSQSTFSAIQFDTSLVGIGDKGIVECDSYQSKLIDIKIPDLVLLQFNNDQTKRVYGIRDYIQRLAYWSYPIAGNSGSSGTFPDRRLVYNYENDSWAIFKDSFTCYGLFQSATGRTWGNTHLTWGSCNFSWGSSKPSLSIDIAAGNQQGFVMKPDYQVVNDPTLTITAITGNDTTPTVITSKNHNLQSGDIIKINNIPTGTPFASSLNGVVFGIQVLTVNTFQLFTYSTTTGQFDKPQLDASGQTYIGGGNIAVVDNFSITSKKFNFVDEGQNIQLGYIDILMDTSKDGAITLNIYINYNDNAPSNQLPQNTTNDDFFNITIPTSASALQAGDSDKTWQRVYCPSRGNFLTIEYTLSNAQMNGVEQGEDVQIDAQILWVRGAGRLSFG